MEELTGGLFTKIGAGIAAIGAGIYGVIRLMKSDRREDTKADLTDGAMSQVIQTLRDEVGRLADRLAKVEEENRRCEEKNTSLQQQIFELQKQMHIA